MNKINESPDVSIVMVNFNQQRYTAQCLDSIYQNPPQVSFEVVLVDNASADGSADWLEQHYPQVKLVRSPVNGGITGGNNLGIRAGSSKYVLLLNNDTIVIPGSIERCKQFLDENPEVGAVGGNLLNADGSFQSGAWEFPTVWEEFLQITKLGLLLRPCYPSHPPYTTAREIDWMSTAFMLFRRQALDIVGLMDELYFIYSDETDLEFRLWQAGWKIFYLPDVNTIHFGGKSLTPYKSRALVYRGRLLFFRKHRGLLQELLVRLIYSTASSLKLVFWSFAYWIPAKRQRAKNELKSHGMIFKQSLTPHFRPIIA